MKKIIALLFIFLCVPACVSCINQIKPTDVYFNVTIDSCNGDEIVSLKVKKGDCAQEPEQPTKNGCVFDGWIYEDSGRGFDFSSVILSDVNVKAKWTDIKDDRPVYSVKFYAKDGVTLLKAQDVREGDAATPPSVSDEKYFRFDGWSGSIDEIITDTDVTAQFVYDQADSELFEYETNRQGYYLIKKLKDDASLPLYNRGVKLALPLYHNDKLIVGVADGESYSDGAFFGRNIESVYIPSSYRVIGAYAFYGNPLLTDLNLCEGLASIGKYAFAASEVTSGDVTLLKSSLTRVKIPASVYVIGEGAFDHIGATSVGGRQTMLVCDVTFGEGSRLLSVGNKAFNGVSIVNLTLVTQGETEIGDYAFAADILSGFDASGSYEMPYSALKKITLGKVKSIGDYAFYGAGNGYAKTKDGYVRTHSAVSLEIDSQSDIIRIGDYAFCDASVVGTLTFECQDLGRKAFFGHSLSEIKIGGLTEVRDYAFSSSALVEYTVTLPSVTAIGDYAFAESQVTKVNVSYLLTSVGTSAFDGCKKLSSIQLGNDLQSVGKRAFYGCELLKEKYEFRNVEVCDYAFAYSGITEVVSRSSIFGEYAFASCNLTAISGVIGSLGKGAFYNCSALVSVELPNYDHKFKIPEKCFYGCSLLKSIEFSRNIDRIGELAFYGCTSLKSVKISSDVARIEPYAFALCSSLSSFEFSLDESASMLSSIGEHAFNGCKELVSIDLPDGVSEIGDYAFAGSGLTAFVTSSSLQKMGYGVFYQQSYVQELNGIQISKRLPALQRFVIASGTGIIEFDKRGTFDGSEVKKFETGSENNAYRAEDGILYSYDGSELVAYIRDATKREIEIDKQVTSISSGAFSGNMFLRSVTLPSSLKIINDYAFFSCSGIKSITIPDSVETIGAYAFSSTKNIIGSLSELKFGSTSRLNYVGESAFAYQSIAKLTLPSLVTEIGDYAFFGTTLADLDFSEAKSLSRIGKGAFSGSKNNVAKVKMLDFSDAITLKEVGYRAFAYSAVEQIIFGDIEVISDGAFRGCTSLTEVIIGEKVKIIGDGAFRNCTSLSKIIIPQNNVLSTLSDYAFAGSDTQKMSYATLDLRHTSINNIGSYAFAYSSVKQAYLPCSGFSLGDEAFLRCDMLEEIELGGCVSIGLGAFDGAIRLKQVALPASLRTIGSSAFAGLNIESVTIGDETNGNDLHNIGKRAFFDCKSLKTVSIYGDNVPVLDGGADNKSFFYSNGTKTSKLSLKIYVDKGMYAKYLPDTYFDENGWSEYASEISERERKEGENEVLPLPISDGSNVLGNSMNVAMFACKNVIYSARRHRAMLPNPYRNIL